MARREEDLFDITGLPFDGGGVNPPDIVKRMGDRLTELQSVANRGSKKDKNRCSTLKNMMDRLTKTNSSGKLVLDKDAYAEACKERRDYEIKRLNVTIGIERETNPSLSVSTAHIKSLASKTKLTQKTVKDEYVNQGFTVDDGIAFKPSFPKGFDGINTDIATLKGMRNLDASKEPFDCIDDLYDFVAYCCRNGHVQPGTLTADDLLRLGSADACRREPTSQLLAVVDAVARRYTGGDSGTIAGALKGVASKAKSYAFDKDDDRAKYDEFVVFTSSEMERLRDLIASADVRDLSDTSFADRCIRRITEIFGDSSKALGIYNYIASEAGLDEPYEGMSKFLVRCPSCGAVCSFDTVKAAQAQNKCQQCGSPLYKRCESCGEMSPVDAKRCSNPKCGKPFPDSAYFDEMIARTEAAVRSGDIESARRYLTQAMVSDPSEKTVTSRLDAQISNLEEEFKKPLCDLDDLIASRRFVAAQQLASSISSQSGLDVSRQSASINAALSECARRMSAAGTDTVARVSAALDCLDVCVDYKTALDVVASTPPRECTCLECQASEGGDSVLLSWSAPSERGVTYTVVRRVGSVAPSSPSDGTVLSRDDTQRYLLDGDVSNGTTYSYAVFAVRHGVSSKAVTGSCMPCKPVDDVRAEQSGNGVIVSFRKPEASAGVRINRTSSGKTKSLGIYVSGVMKDDDVRFGERYSYELVATYDGGHESLPKSVSIVPSPTVGAFRISVSKVDDTTYDVSWDIRQSGVDLQVMASGAFVASARSDDGHCRINLRRNASYSVYVEAMSEGKWKRSDNAVDVSTYGLPSISCKSSEVTHPSSHGDVSTVTIDVSFVGTIPPDAKSLSVIVRTKRSEMDAAPWASQGDARSSEAHVVDVSTYQRTNVMSVSLSCGMENAYYVTAFVIYRNGQISSPIKRRVDRPLSASIFWKVTKGLFGGARLSVDMEASRPVGSIPSLVLCVSSDGGNVLSPSSRNASIVLTTKKKMIAASTSESFSIDLPKQDVKKGDRVFLFQGDDDDDRFALRWASGFNGRL